MLAEGLQRQVAPEAALCCIDTASDASHDIAMRSPIDLLTPVVGRERWHPNFVRLVEDATEQERQVLRDWAKDFIDRDGKFVFEFQTTFNSSFWELYLHALWRELGCERDQSFSRPDFVITGGTLGRFVAEAVITSHPAGGEPEWTADPLSAAMRAIEEREDVLDLACLRLSQAINEKCRKWVDEYQHLQQCAEQPFVICVAPFDHWSPPLATGSRCRRALRS